MTGEREVLSQKELARVFLDDCYLAVPESILAWLNELKLRSTERALIKTIIGMSIKKGHWKKGVVCARLSYSLIKKFTGIDSKTIERASKSLQERGILKHRGVSDKGTLYEVLLGKTVLSYIKIRTPSKKPSQLKGEGRPPIPPVSPVSPQGRSDLEAVREKLNLLLAKRANFLRENDLTLRKVVCGQVDKGHQEILDELCIQISNLESQIKANSNPDAEGVDTSLQESFSSARNKRKTLFDERAGSPKYVSKKLFEYIKKKIHARKEISNPTQVVLEILWSLRFGWHARFKGSSLKASNHAMKMISSGTWRTPYRYNQDHVKALSMHLSSHG